MFLYKDNRFHFNNISFCLPDNVYVNTNCEEYDDCIELVPNGSDFRIIIYAEYSESDAKQFFSSGEKEACYRIVGEITPFSVGEHTGYSCQYSSSSNAYAEYRFDIEERNDVNVLGVLVHTKSTVSIEEAVNHSAVTELLERVLIV